MIIADLLNEPGAPYAHTISATRSVTEALEEMNLKNAAALVVVKDDRPVGILSEHDVFRCCRLRGNASFSEIAVGDAMSRDFFCAEPGQDVGGVLEKMLRLRIRHLPVTESGKLVGLLSVDDLARRQLDFLKGEIRFLEDYIARLQDAAHD